MISSNDFRPGVSIELDGGVWRVVEFLHVKPGKGAAFVRTKLKNVQSGNVVERTFRAGETVPQANLEKSTMQHTYKDGDNFVFMDMETYEEASLSPAQIGDRVKYLKEGMEVKISFEGDDAILAEAPTFVEAQITYTEPGLKGDTATNTLKSATIDTGTEIRVPLFTNEGDWVKIDTRTGEYVERVKEA